MQVPVTAGVVGQAVSKRCMLNITDLYNDPYYNSVVDLITTFPVAVIPVNSI